MNFNPLSSLTHSYVSPRMGLNGFLPARCADKAYEDTANAATRTIRSNGSGQLAASSRSSLYSSSSHNRWRALSGSFILTGIEILERSLPVGMEGGREGGDKYNWHIVQRQKESMCTTHHLYRSPTPSSVYLVSTHCVTNLINWYFSASPPTD